MAEIATFEKIAPYLTHPLVLAGFTLFLVFGLYKVLIQSGIIPPVGPHIGGRLVQSMLRYGFVLALVVVVLVFVLQFLQTPPEKPATENLHIQNSQINIGIPPEQLQGIITAATGPLHKLTAEQQATISRLQRELGVNQAQLHTFFQTIGEAAVPPERMGTKLVEIAQNYRQLLQGTAPTPGDEPAIATLKQRARLALDAGELEQADALLIEVQQIQDQAADRLALEAAKTSAKRAQIALTRLRYPDAAQRFAEAAARVPFGQDQVRWQYLDSQAYALYRQGDEKGDNAALQQAIDLYQKLAGQINRQAHPLEWAGTQTNLGTALFRLGERESGTARLQAAVAAFRAALQERTRERVPLDWAMTQNNLGNVLRSLGKREPGTTNLQAAVTAYRAALQERTRERVPLDWAMTQNNLGTALSMLGERESGTTNLQAAVAAYRAALQEYTRERVPLDWATTQNNLGTALFRLGESEPGTANLQAAVAAYRAALQERTRKRVPLDWAITQNNLGTALMSLGERESGTAKLQAAVAAYHAALQERTRERVPLHWAGTQNNLGIAFWTLGERTSDIAHLQAAKQATQAAYAVFREAGYAHYQADFEERLATIDRLIDNLKQ